MHSSVNYVVLVAALNTQVNIYKIFEKKPGDEPRQEQHAATQANKGSPLLSKEVTYWIALIGCSQGGLSRSGEEVIWKVLTENDCNTLYVRCTDLESKSRSGPVYIRIE